MQHTFIGNVNLKNNLTVDGDLNVLGTSTIIDSETIVAKDNIIQVNTPATSSVLAGLISSVHLDNLAGPQYSGLSGSASANTITVSQAIQPGWAISVFGQKRIILSVSGFILTVAPWSSIPPIGSAYDLYRNTNAGFFYDQSNAKFLIGGTHNSMQIQGGILRIGRIEQELGEQITYVGKHGSDSFSGTTIAEAKLTFGTLTGTVVCFDSGTYTSCTLNNGSLFAPNATITSLNISNSSAVIGVAHVTSSGTSNLIFHQLNGMTISGLCHIHGENVTDTIVVNGTVDGYISNLTATLGIDCLGATNLMIDKASCTTLADAHISGNVRIFGCDLSGAHIGPVIAIDVGDIASHIGNTSNPHAVTFSQISPFTSQGDLLTYSTMSTVLPCGNLDEVLTVSSTPTGLAWRGNTRKIVMISPDSTILNDTKIIASFAWKQSEFSGFVSGKLIFSLDGIATISFGGSSSTFSAGISTLAFTLPITDTLLQLSGTASGTIISGVSMILAF